MPILKLQYVTSQPIMIGGGFVIDECGELLGTPHATAGAIGRLFGFVNPEPDAKAALAKIPYAEQWGRDVHLKLDGGAVRHHERVYPPMTLLILACELRVSAGLRAALAVWARESAEGRARRNKYGGPPY